MVSNQIYTINNFMVASSLHSSHRLDGQESTSQCTCAGKINKNKNLFLCQELKPGAKWDYYTTKLLTYDTK